MELLSSPYSPLLVQFHHEWDPIHARAKGNILFQFRSRKQPLAIARFPKCFHQIVSLEPKQPAGRKRQIRNRTVLIL